MATLTSITVDCAHPASIARFWAAALEDYAVRPYDAEEIRRLRERGVPDVEDDPSVAVDPAGAGPTLFFTRVPEPKTTKNRLHLDVVAPDTLDAEVDRLVGLGATKLRTLREDGRVWTVLQDPEGNEFCVEQA